MYKWIVATVLVLTSLGILLWATGCGRQVEESTAPHAMAPVETPHSTEVHAPDSEHAYTYTCPTCPDVKQDHPGKCSSADCEMFWEAETDEAVEYHCPMHEDVVQDKPGKCPDCGMYVDARPKSE